MKPLLDLKKTYDGFSPFWEQWVECPENGLSKLDIEEINLRAKQNFKRTFFEYFHFSWKSRCTELTRILEDSYLLFQEKVITTFMLAIVRMAATENFDSFLSTPILELPISKEFRGILERFGFNTCDGLLAAYTDEDFKREDIFNIVVDLLSESNSTICERNNSFSSFRNSFFRN